MITRRRFGQAAAATFVGLAIGGKMRTAEAAAGLAQLPAEFARIEKESGGRLGVAVLDTGSGAHAGHRADERFPMCSTFKLIATAAVLARVDAGHEHLDRRIRFTERDLMRYAPVTKNHVGGEGMTLGELCAAAMEYSDNTAANLILASLGGPKGVTAFAHRLGDKLTRLDRIEPALNEAIPGDPRDTTTPAAMASDLRKIVLGNALSDSSKAQLTAWLRANKTGDARLRAGLPKDWQVGDKTGSGPRGTANDIALAWPPGHAPVIVTVYLTGATGTPEQREAAIAAVGRAAAAALA